MTAEPAIRVVVVDDEPLARGRVVAALARHPDLEVVGEAEDGDEAVELLRSLQPDVAFLDVRMPGRDGFEVLRALAPRERPFVVFVTAFGDRAVDAFRVHAVDYVVKPFDDDDFDDAVSRVRGRLAAAQPAAGENQLAALLAALPATAPQPATRVRVQDDGRTFFVPVASIRFLEADGNYVVLHTPDAQHRIRATLSGLLERLDASRFVRIHRSTVVNLDALREVQPWFSGDYLAILDDGHQLRVSRHFRDDLLRAFH